MKFYKCELCGNVVEFMTQSGVPVFCCGEEMTELVPGTSDGAAEKHVPVAETEGNRVKVCVGEAEHPMVETHYIEWIVLETKKGAQKVYLKPGQRPCAEFVLTDTDEAVAAYEYCNIHGLWKADIIF